MCVCARIRALQIITSDPYLSQGDLAHTHTPKKKKKHPPRPRSLWYSAAWVSTFPHPLFSTFSRLPFPFQSVSSRSVKRLLFHNIPRTHTHTLCSNLRLCPRSPPRRRGSVVMRVLRWRHWNKWAVSLSGTLVAGRGGDSRRNFTLLLR